MNSVINFLLMVYSYIVNRQYVVLLKYCNKLKDALNADDHDERYGICRNLELVGYEDDGSLLKKVFSKWPKFSGNNVYPVPVDDVYGNEYNAYIHHCPKWKGNYGKLRIELLDFMIAECERVLNPKFDYKDVVKSIVKRYNYAKAYVSCTLLLRRYKKGTVRDIGNGICANAAGVSYATLVDAFKEWPKFSGRDNFPIPSPKPAVMTSGAYYFSTISKWEADQGEAREELLKFMIKFYRKVVFSLK